MRAMRAISTCSAHGSRPPGPGMAKTVIQHSAQGDWRLVQCHDASGSGHDGQELGSVATSQSVGDSLNSAERKDSPFLKTASMGSQQSEDPASYFPLSHRTVVDKPPQVRPWRHLLQSAVTSCAASEAPSCVGDSAPCHSHASTPPVASHMRHAGDDMAGHSSVAPHSSRACAALLAAGGARSVWGHRSLKHGRPVQQGRGHRVCH